MLEGGRENKVCNSREDQAKMTKKNLGLMLPVASKGATLPSDVLMVFHGKTTKVFFQYCIFVSFLENLAHCEHFHFSKDLNWLGQV